MSQLNSSISSSSSGSSGRAGQALRLCAWIVISLAAVDAFINLIFAYPSDPRNIHPTWFQTYFEFGRSTDGQLRRMTRPDRSLTAPITLSGWYDPLVVEAKTGGPQDSVVTVYGMSHAVQLAEALGELSGKYRPRVVGAPGATSNWSYGAYLRDRGGSKSRAVVLAFMSANLPMITTMSPMTWNIGFPMPYTGDRFYLENNELRVAHPPYDSFEKYVNTLSDPEKWAAACNVFAKYDTMYSPFIRESNILDHSSLFRLIRRAYGLRLERNARAASMDQTGFQPESEQVKVARAIVHEFAQRSRADGMVPVIFIVNNFGYSDYLFRALEPTLNADKIPFVSSHQVVSPNDPRGYLSDSHFTPAVNVELARALVKAIENGK